MKISTEFAPKTIVIETAKELTELDEILWAAYRGCGKWSCSPTDLQEKVLHLRKMLGFK